MFLPKHYFSQLVVLNKIFLHKQLVPLYLQILVMYFLMYSTEGHSILYCCLRDYKPCRKQFHNWQDKWCKLSCRFESQLSYVDPFTIDNLFENLPTNLSSSLDFLFRVINRPIWRTNSVDTVVLVVRMFHLHVF